MSPESTDRLFKLLDASMTLEAVVPEVQAYLRAQLEAYIAHPHRGREIAYEIAGLLATRAARSLSDDDPYAAVFHMAAGLELPVEDRPSGATWEQLATLVSRLP